MMQNEKNKLDQLNNKIAEIPQVHEEKHQR